MTRAEIFTDPAFLRLSDQQQAFVRALVENGGDSLDAALKAYKCKDNSSATTMANRNLRKIQIKRLVDAYFGKKLEERYPSRKELAAIAWERAQNTEDGDLAHKWASLAARVLGYDKAEPEPDKPKGWVPAATSEDPDVLKELERRGLTNGPAQ